MNEEKEKTSGSPKSNFSRYVSTLITAPRSKKRKKSQTLVKMIPFEKVPENEKSKLYPQITSLPSGVFAWKPKQ